MDEIMSAITLLRSKGYKVIPPERTASEEDVAEILFSSDEPCRFGDFVFDAVYGTLAIGNRCEVLTLAQSRVLQILLMNWDKPVSVDDITEYVWPGRRYVPMSNLYTHISFLRGILKADPSIRLENYRSEGYRLRQLK